MAVRPHFLNLLVGTDSLLSCPKFSAIMATDSSSSVERLKSLSTFTLKAQKNTLSFGSSRFCSLNSVADSSKKFAN